jgi:hypothetical protein
MNRLLSSLLALLLGVTVVVAPRTTCAEEAETVTARLSWERQPGAESCIDRSQLEKAINRRWRRQVFVEDDAAELTVAGKVGRSGPDRWSASIEMRRADGTSLGSRELVTHAPDCSALDDSVALALGIMLDMTKQRIVEERALRASRSTAPAGTSTSAAAKNPPAAKTPVVTGPAITIPPETAAPRAPWHVEPSVSVLGSYGVLPQFDFGGRAAVSVLPPDLFRFELSIALFFPHDAPNDKPGAKTSAWSGELAAYPFVLASDTLRFDAGAGIRFLDLRAEGVGLDQNGVANEVIVALGPRTALAWRFAGRFELVVGGGVEVALSRYRFLYRDSHGGTGKVRETGIFSGEAYAGLALFL